MSLQCAPPRRSMAARGVAAAALSVALAATFVTSVACSRPTFRGEQTRPLVITSVEPLGSIFRNVAGDRARVEAIVPPGRSAYGYRLSESDRDLVARAALAIFNGMGYDDTLIADVSASAGPSLPVVDVGRSIVTADAAVAVTPTVQPGAPQSPFMWMDPLQARAYAAIARDALVRLDPASTPVYNQNFERFAVGTTRIATALSDTISTVPPTNRRVFAQVDVLDHFAPRVGLTSLGASQTFDGPQPGPAAASAIGASLAPLGLPAVFSTAPTVSPAMETIAAKAGVRMTVMVRYEDLPGPPGSLSHTYFGLVIENTRVMAQALGGSTEPLADARPNDVAPVT